VESSATATAAAAAAAVSVPVPLVVSALTLNSPPPRPPMSSSRQLRSSPHLCSPEASPAPPLASLLSAPETEGSGACEKISPFKRPKRAGVAGHSTASSSFVPPAPQLPSTVSEPSTSIAPLPEPLQTETLPTTEEPAGYQASNEPGIGVTTPSISSGRPPLQPMHRSLPESAQTQASVLQSSTTTESKVEAAPVYAPASRSTNFPRAISEAEAEADEGSVDVEHDSLPHAHPQYLPAASVSTTTKDPPGARNAPAGVSSAKCANDDGTVMVEHLKGIEGILAAMHLQQQANSQSSSLPPPPPPPTIAAPAGTSPPLQGPASNSPAARNPSSHVELSSAVPSTNGHGDSNYATSAPEKINKDDDEEATKLLATVAARAKQRALAAAFPSTMKLLEKKKKATPLPSTGEQATKKAEPSSTSLEGRISPTVAFPSSPTATKEPPSSNPQKANASPGASLDLAQQAATVKLKQWRARYVRRANMVPRVSAATAERSGAGDCTARSKNGSSSFS